MAKIKKYVFPVSCVTLATVIIIIILEGCFSIKRCSFDSLVEFFAGYLSGYLFEIDENRYATLTKINYPAETVELPSKILFYDVKNIGGISKSGLFGTGYTTLFDGNDVTKHIIISEGIEETDGPAIRNCKNLEKVTVPSTMRVLIISDCKNLKEVNFTESDIIIKQLSFSDCEGLESIELPDRISDVSDNAFARCFSLKNVSIPENVISIGSTSFQSCNSLKQIDLPDELTTIGPCAFQWCDSLENINIPPKVESIQSYTFDTCEALKTVNLSENLSAIYDGAFADCTSLERINIYDNVTYIAENAFEGCDKLTIYGIKGSYAEQYANEHNIPFEELN